ATRVVVPGEEREAPHQEPGSIVLVDALVLRVDREEGRWARLDRPGHGGHARERQGDRERRPARRCAEPRDVEARAGEAAMGHGPPPGKSAPRRHVGWLTAVSLRLSPAPSRASRRKIRSSNGFFALRPSPSDSRLSVLRGPWAPRTTPTSPTTANDL